jgi:uncharacterized protein YfbU (UPF0304 family)
MELTTKDRLILINQYQILKRLDPKAEQQCDQAIEILKYGYSQLYGQIGADVADSEMCSDKCQVVCDVVGAYKALGAYTAKNPGDKEVAGHPWAKFRGFHPGTEGEYLGYARFLESNTPESDAPTLSKSRMIAAYWAAQGRPEELTRDIVAAMLGLGGPAVADEEDEATDEEAFESAVEAPAETQAAEPKAAPRTRKRTTAK